MYSLHLHSYILIVSLLASFVLSDTPVSLGQGIDDQANEISKLLLCPVCQGQSVAESNSNLANDMRQIIRKQLREGKTKDEIVTYFVESYGETILGAPPAKGVNWLLWILPGLAILFGLFGIGLFLYQSGSNKKEITSGTEKTESDGDDSYLDKIDEELNREDS